MMREELAYESSYKRMTSLKDGWDKEEKSDKLNQKLVEEKKNMIEEIRK